MTYCAGRNSQGAGCPFDISRPILLEDSRSESKHYLVNSDSDGLLRCHCNHTTQEHTNSIAASLWINAAGRRDGLGLLPYAISASSFCAKCETIFEMALFKYAVPGNLPEKISCQTCGSDLPSFGVIHRRYAFEREDANSGPFIFKYVTVMSLLIVFCPLALWLLFDYLGIR